jgi:hypothetical protein
VSDALNLKAKGEHQIFPRRKEMKVWENVAPYRTRKGKLSTWKLNKEKASKQEASYDIVQKRVSETVKLDELSEISSKFKDLLDVYGNVPVTVGFLRMAVKEGLIIIQARTAWHGYRKLGWRKSYTTIESEVKEVRRWKTPNMSSNTVEPEYYIPKFGSTKPKYDDRKEYHLTYGTHKGKKPEWVDMKLYHQALEEAGYSMKRGGLIKEDDDRLYWYDPVWEGNVEVYENLRECPYDESQGDDPSGEEDWIQDALEGGPEHIIEEEEIEEDEETEEEC